MASNDFLPFAAGGSANVESQAAYAADSHLLNGLVSGIVPSNLLNKTLRQSSIISAMVAQFIADETGANSVDDGTNATLLANMKLGINNMIGATGDKIKQITATVAANALTVGLNPITLSFRSATLADGTISSVIVGSALSLTVPSTATLGTINAATARLVLLALNNAGTAELAIVNLSGGNNLDETTLISTTAISAAATSANVIYSTAARTSVAFRVVGFIDISEATAGTWATGPTTIQGEGGQALTAMSSIGYGQTVQVITPVSGTTYYNTTGKPIYIGGGTSAGTAMTIGINGVTVMAFSYGSGSSIVPQGGSYVFTGAAMSSLFAIK